MADATKPKTPLWMRLTLFVSIALNVLVVGAIAGFLLMGGPDRRSDRDRFDFGAVYMRALSEQDQRALRRDFLSGLQKEGRDRGAFIAYLRATLDTLRATPFDEKAFEAALANQSRARAEREDMGRAILASRVATMTDAERAAYADRIEDRLAELAKRIRR